MVQLNDFHARSKELNQNAPMPTNPNTAEPQKPRRHWFQFTLRTLLIAVMPLAVTCTPRDHTRSPSLH